MIHFVKRLSKFLFICSLIFLFLQFLILFLNRSLIKKCDLRAGTTSLIIGDSHIMWSIDDSNLDHVQNISLNAEGYIYSYAKLKNALVSNPGISKVYLGMNYHNLSGYFDDYIYGGLMRHLIYRYLGVLSINDYIQILVRNPKNIIELPKCILGKGTVQVINNDCVLYGSFPDENMMEQLDREKVEKRIHEQFYKNNEVIYLSEINLLYLNKIVDLCKEKHIKLTIISTPLQIDYMKMIPEEYKNYYEKYLDENKLQHYNFGDLILPDTCYLPDGDHVNYYGAKLVTQKFKEYYENFE